MYIKIMSIMKKILALLGVVLVVASCSKDTDTKVEMASGEGAMRLGLAMPAEIADEDVVIKVYKVEEGNESLIRRGNSRNCRL